MNRRFAVSQIRHATRVNRSAAALATLLLLIFAAAATTASAGTLNGTVKNGTTGQVAAGADVILIQLQGGMQPVANTKTDAQGQFHFDNPQLGTGPMLVRVVYKGVNYHEPITPGKMTANHRSLRAHQRSKIIQHRESRHNPPTKRRGPDGRRRIYDRK